MKKLLLLLLLWFWPCPARASIEDCIDATCRIYNGGGAGSGTVFSQSDDQLFILTNAHVAGTQPGGSVRVQFWKSGYRSQTIAGTNVWTSYAPLDRGYHRDIAIVAVEKSAFTGGILPGIIPIAGSGTGPVDGETVISVGCPGARWPSAFKGHVIKRNDGNGGSIITFSPPPEAGRSGSGIFDEAGTCIIGLLAWGSGANENQDFGIAMTLAELQSALSGASPGQIAQRNDPTPIQLQSPVDELYIAGQLVPVDTPRRCSHGLRFTEPCSECQCPGGSCPSQGGSAPSRQGPAYGPWSGPGMPSQTRPPSSLPPTAAAPPAPMPPAQPPVDLTNYVTKDDLGSALAQVKTDLANQATMHGTIAGAIQADVAKVKSQLASTTSDLQTKLSQGQSDVLGRAQAMVTSAVGEVKTGLQQQLGTVTAQAGQAAQASALQVFNQFVAQIAPQLASIGGAGLTGTAALGLTGPIGLAVAAVGLFISRAMKSSNATATAAAAGASGGGSQVVFQLPASLGNFIGALAGAAAAGGQSAGGQTNRG